MARIRSLKPSIWADERFSEVGRDARLLFIGMISHADDDGRLVASASSLLGAIYPHDDPNAKQVEKWRAELVAVGLIEVYQHGKGTYAHLIGWANHQYIQKRMKSTLPPPPVRDESGSGPVAVTDGHQPGSGPEVEVDMEGEMDMEVEPHPSFGRSSGLDLDPASHVRPCGNVDNQAVAS